MIHISSFNHLVCYLSTLGAKLKKLDDNSLLVSDNLILVYDNGYVIPTGFNSGFLYDFCNDIANLLPTYI